MIPLSLQLVMIALSLQLCITINNIEQVRRSLKPLPSLLELSEVQQAMDLAAAMAADTSHASLGSLIKAADDDMVKKIRQVVDRVADKVSVKVAPAQDSGVLLCSLLVRITDLKITG